MPGSTIESRVERAEYEIDGMKSMMADVSGSLRENTEATKQLITQLTVYTTKHDGLEGQLKDVSRNITGISKTQIEHGIAIANMKPIVDGLSGLVWKIIGAIVVSGAGLGTIMTAIMAYMSK